MPERLTDPRDPSHSPRLRLLNALRSGLRTVNALAERLQVTDNAVRGLLAALERDGLVRQAGVVRSGVAGKPAIEYELTDDAGIALSRAYAPALEALVAALADRLEPRALRAALADAGRRLTTPPSHRLSLAARAGAARDVLTRLGGSVHTVQSQRHVELRGDGCPLAAAVARVPDTCVMVEAMLDRHTGRKVDRHCEHGARPQCAFRLH